MTAAIRCGAFLGETATAQAVQALVQLAQRQRRGVAIGHPRAHFSDLLVRQSVGALVVSLDERQEFRGVFLPLGGLRQDPVEDLFHLFLGHDKSYHPVSALLGSGPELRLMICVALGNFYH